ncbi:MAG: DUF1631 domain-containing protein [Gammaproteobacteria bacterium]
MPPILETVRHHARKQLAALLEGLFNNIDDALFEMADRSRSDADQSLYFESMRELRLQREHIRKTFARGFTDGFEEAFSPVEETDEEIDMDNVSMVGNDELEITVAVAGIVSKVTSQHSLLVMQLTKRMDHLAKDVEIIERTNPLGPEMLSRAFVQALENADLDIKVRIILLKLFERFVMERLAPVYTDANQLLVDAGVLPDLKSAMRPRRHHQDRSDNRPEVEPSAGPIAAATGGGSAGYAGGTSFSAIQDLLAAARGPVHSGERMTTGPGRITALSTADVLTALTDAQLELDAPIDIESVPTVLDLRELVISRAPAKGAGAAARLSQVEDDVVNFVGMLFDYILNDRNLAIPMKALIGRLQLPIVKLAVMDRSFFDKPNHPARQLLNELSSAGIGWSSAKELKRDAMYNMVESVVLRVMNGFKDDPTIFEDVLLELRGFVKSDTRKREQAEQRVKDNEKGRARTVSAKQVVQKLINQKASGMRLPVEVGRFLSDTWSKVLVLTCVRDSDRSPAWHEQTETLDDLLWCLQPLGDLADIERRERKVPGLLRSLSVGMGEIQLTESEIDRHLKEIETHLTAINSNDRAYLEEDEAPPMDDTFEVMEEIVLTLPGEQPDAAVNVEVEPEYIEQIGKLREGSWVELTQATGETLRCKLSTIIEPGGRYIFVNRRGMKVAERSRRGLAVELKRNSLTILEESQVFDRALQAVIGNLRQMQRSPR